MSLQYVQSPIVEHIFYYTLLKSLNFTRIQDWIGIRTQIQIQNDLKKSALEMKNSFWIRHIVTKHEHRWPQF